MPKVVTSAHYMLSDLYVPDDVDGGETAGNSSEDSDDQTEAVSTSCVTLNRNMYMLLKES